MSFLPGNTKEKLTNFTKFAGKELGIKHMPIIVILNSREDLKTSANYDYEKEHKIIKIRAKNRWLVDIMRSIGHELTHHKQWEVGLLKIKPPDIGGPIEDGANAMAGQLIKKYAQIDPTIYE